MRAIVLVVLCLCSALPCGHARAWSTLSAAQAGDHVGEQARVCGITVSTRYAESSNGSPTFLNLDRPYPDQIFTALVWGEDRDKFRTPPETLEGRKICVDGVISTHKGRPQIIVREPGQIKVIQDAQ